MIKAVIFDLDGVLVDTAVLHYQAWKAVSESNGWAFDVDVNEKLKGVSRVESLEIILAFNNKTLDEEKKHQCLTEKNDLYKELISKLTKQDLLPGVTEVLDFLKSRNIRVALGSASKNANFILDITGISGYFEAIVDGNMVTNSKPDPEVFQRGAELLDVPAEHCLVLEDSEAGIQAAIDAGMKIIGVGNSKELAEADLIIEGFNDEKLDHYFEQSL